MDADTKTTILQMALAAAIGFGAHMGLQAAAAYARFRGRKGVERAKAAMAAAELTPDEQDDVAARMALARATADEKALEYLAEQLEQIRAARAAQK